MHILSPVRVFPLNFQPASSTRLKQSLSTVQLRTVLSVSVYLVPTLRVNFVSYPKRRDPIRFLLNGHRCFS